MIKFIIKYYYFLIHSTRLYKLNINIIEIKIPANGIQLELDFIK